MAQAVEQALEEKRHLVVEAGTGTGKTLAYLVPAIRSGKRIIISTGTKNLQEQLFFKDIPFWSRRCFQRRGQAFSLLHEGAQQLCLPQAALRSYCAAGAERTQEIEQFQTISAWEATTETGDRAEIGGLPESSLLWPKLDARSETCLFQKCSQFDRCFITEMHRRATESDIIIVNHHLFFADLAIKQQAEGAPDAGVLPDLRHRGLR